MSCEAASWIPDAVTATLHCGRSAEPVIAWLSLIRATIDEYEPLITVRPQSLVSEQSTNTSSTTPDSAFDEILSQLGKEIYKLDEYQKNLIPDEREVSLSILNLFDECLDVINEDEARTQQNKETNDIYATNDIVAAADSVVNGAGGNSEGGSSLSEASFVTSTPNGPVRVTDSDTDIAFEVKPLVPARARLKTPPTPHYVDMDVKTNAAVTPKRLGSVSDSESTCWSYKECSSETEDECNRQKYAAVWSHSSGYHNSDDILRQVISKQYATVSRLSFDTTCDLAPSEFSVYTLREVGDRCAGDVSVASAAPVAAMTPDEPTVDDTGGYEPVRDAITTDENIYEEIDYCNGNSYTDEGCSCGGSIEVESCSMSACSEGIGRDSPLYANLRDPDAYTIPSDVIYWTKLLLDPFCNEDEDEEWITPEECSEYSREQRPPFVIPRIRYREPRRELRSQQRLYAEDSILEAVPSGRQYERPDYGPGGDRNRPIEIRNLKSGADNYGRLDKRLGNSTENLLTARRPNHLQIPASSSGDSLNVELRDKEPENVRNRKVRSMVAPKTKKSPVPAPRMMIPQPAEASVVLEGPIKRTKFTEGGKKTKKNWTDCYMVLTTTALIFYKDKKTFDASNIPKPLGTPPSPTAPRAEIVLALQNAHVVQCIQTHTRRYTRSLMLTVDYDQYLLQDETEEGAKKLLKHIQNIIYKLGPPALDEMRETVNHYQSSNTDLESLGRTPPVSRHIHKAKQKAGGSSNEDLSDSTEKVKSKLRKFLHKRPSKDILYKKGILRDEPIFGRNLADVCPGSSPLVPHFVVACVREIESSEENMCTDGLYRASGNLSQVQKIRLEVDQNNLKVLEENTDIHVLTGSLKLFFRELKEPLIPWSMFDRVLNACSMRPREVRIKEFRDIIHSLPQCNRDTLKYLLEHLLRVTEYSDRNRMHTANLAIVFGPTLLWAPPEQSHRIAYDCIQQNNVVEILLNDFAEIFRD